MRTIPVHERSLAFLCALVTAIVAFEPRIRGGGLNADDWAEYAAVRFPHALGFHSSLAAVASDAGSRIGATLYWLVCFSLFGSHTRLYSLAAVTLAAVMAFAIYVLLRELRFSIMESLAMMLLTIVAPTLATVRFWFTPSGSQLSLTLFFVGLTLALRAFSAEGKKSLRLHTASWCLYVLSDVYAEVALPLMGIGILVYVTRAPLSRSLRRWALDLIIVIFGYLATSSFVNSTAGFSKLPQSMWGYHAELLGEQALTIFTSMLGEATEGRHWSVLAGLGLLAVTGVLLSRSTRTLDTTVVGLRRWAFTFGIGIVAIVACYTVYIPGMLYYEPLDLGLSSHINVATAMPLACAVFAVLMYSYFIIAELLGRIRLSLRPIAPALIAAWFGIILVMGLRDVRHNGRIWSQAGDQDLHVLHVLTVDLSDPVHGSTVYTFGEAGTVAPGLPVFFSSFELTNAVKIAYHRGDISAYPVVTNDDVVNCGYKGITVVTGTTPLNPPSRYGQSYFVNISTGAQERIDSRAACAAALSTFLPGPYALSPTQQWSL